VNNRQDNIKLCPHKYVAMNLIQILTPRIPRRGLLFVAASLWTFAGSMLIYKGYLMLDKAAHMILLRLLISLVAGLLFYWFMFAKISAQHTTRIMGLEKERPCLFSFFNGRSYLLMLVMISGGIFFRRSGLVPQNFLASLYLTMGVPLSLSSVRFYYTGIFYHRIRSEKL